MTAYQSAILGYIRENGSITKKQAVALIGHAYFHNAAFHVGNVLTRMVRANMIQRKSQGVYVPTKAEVQNVIQTTIF